MLVRWIVLVLLSAGAVISLLALHVSAAPLLGPMAAAIAMAGASRPLRVPQPLFLAVQAIVGIMIGRVFSLSLAVEVGRRWPVFIAATGSVLLAACLLGFALTRWRVLPGTTALWGAFPGAAMTMTLMAGDYGADIRLVAFMQYFRVVLVALAASAVALVVVPASAHPGGLMGALQTLVASGQGSAAEVTKTLATAGIGAGVALCFRVPAGALLGAMALGAVAQDTGLLTIALPPPLLTVAYALVGWAIGARFDRPAIAAAAQALPRVAAALGALIGGCALLSVALSRIAGVDALTAYLAMSPGGADSVAIIAASVPKVDMAFVMALQVSRFLVILAFGPALARRVARWAEPNRSIETTAC